MPDYQLYYWPVPFRGQFIRAALAYAQKSWSEADGAEISAYMAAPSESLPIPFMAPPLLIDNSRNFAIAQMPAVMLYLGDTLHLMPTAPGPRAVTAKIINDANDVLDEITLNGGKSMWTGERWQRFEPRLKRWMSLWEELGRRHGLQAGSGYLLGGDAPGIADIMTATLWNTMTERFRLLAEMLEDTAPITASLSRRIYDLPALAALARKAQADYGSAYCGGQIEKALRRVLRA